MSFFCSYFTTSSPNSLRIETYSHSLRWPWCAPSIHLFSSSNVFPPQAALLFMVDTLPKSSYLSDGVTPSQTTVIQLMNSLSPLPIFLFDLFFLYNIITFFPYSHPRNITISIYCCFLCTWAYIPLKLGLCVLIPAVSPAAQITPDIKDVLSD